MKCTLLMTGDELITGVTIDTNSAWIAGRLLELGIPVSKKVTVGDNFEDLAKEIDSAIQASDLLMINGGLGPTVDDLTAGVLASVCKTGLTTHPTAEHHILEWCKSRGVQPTPANLKQAQLPKGCKVIPNRRGSAVGLWLRKGNCLVMCTPGVPHEMKEMFTQEIVSILTEEFSINEMPRIRRLQVFGMGESSIQQRINNEFSDWPKEVKLGFRAGFPSLELKLTTNTDKDKHTELSDTCESRIRKMLGSVIYGENNDNMPSVILRELALRNETVAVAESCTGGLLASLLTEISGASQSFVGGVVCYSNEMKINFLGVKPETLAQHGAVSEQTVREMLLGILARTSATRAIAISGIAGPKGGSDERPTGTVWIAWGTRKNLKASKIFYPADRKQLQSFAATCALDLLRRDLLEINESPPYLKK